MTTLPPFLREKAQNRKIPEDMIDDLWADHCERASIDGVDAGGRRWEKFLDAVVANLKDTRALSEAEAERASRQSKERKARAKAKDAADAAYALEAVSLRDWLLMLRRQADDPNGEMLSAAEVRLLDAGEPPKSSEAVAAWIVDVLVGGTRAQREQACHCGMSVERWTFDGRAYSSATCAEHRRT